MLSLDEIKKVARLSKLELTEDEMLTHQKELSGILDFFEKLSEVNTEGVEPLSQVTGLQNVLRKDVVEDFSAEKLLAASSREKAQNMVSVPNVF